MPSKYNRRKSEIFILKMEFWGLKLRRALVADRSSWFERADSNHNRS